MQSPSSPEFCRRAVSACTKTYLPRTLNINLIDVALIQFAMKGCMVKCDTVVCKVQHYEAVRCHQLSHFLLEDVQRAVLTFSLAMHVSMWALLQYVQYTDTG